MNDVLPFGARVAVVDRPAGDTQVGSLILPMEVALTQVDVGIIVRTTTDTDAPELEAVIGLMGAMTKLVTLKKGMVIYYLKDQYYGIGDVKIVDLQAIVAYEEELS